MIEGLDGVVHIIDDLLVWGETVRGHNRRLVQFLKKAREESQTEQKQEQNLKSEALDTYGQQMDLNVIQRR